MPANLLRYVLITPARNEAAFIEKCIQAVIAQTVLPLRWVIVSDGSTDGTDEIVKQYAARHSWIELVRMPERKERNFGGKVRAFNAGYERVAHLDFELVGNLDADISLEPDHLEYLLEQFGQNPRLGVAGTNYWEHSWDKAPKHDYRFADIQDVSGACQLLRRKCYEDIGGYQPSRVGGVDLIATISARMHGWTTRTFTGKLAIHHRQQGTAEAHSLLVEFHNGRKDFMFGGHPVWELFRATYRLGRKPFFIGGCLVLAGYLWAMLTRTNKVVTPDLLAFRRREQMARLGRLIRKLFISPSETRAGSPIEIKVN